MNARMTRPAVTDAPEESFILGGLIKFNVSAAKRIVSDGRATEEIATAVLHPVLGFLGCWPDQAAALPAAALDEPLILATTETGGSQIIDGLHRIHAAHTRGRETLSVVRLTREESVAVQYGEVTL